MVTEQIPNLMEIRDAASTQELLKKINEGNKVMVSIHHNNDGKNLVWDEKNLFVFDVCRSGKPEHNVVSVIRDLLKINYTPGRWTRKKVEVLIDFVPFHQGTLTE